MRPASAEGYDRRWHDRERRRSLLRPGAALIVLLAAAALGWTIGSARDGARTVTHTVTTAATPPGVREHTRAGAVAAASAYLANAALVMCPGCEPAVWSPHGAVSQVWQLAYRLESYNAAQATVRTWGLALNEGGSSAGAASTPAVEWALTDTEVRWTGTRWAGTGQTLGVSSDGAAPPAGSAGSAAGRAFADSLSGFSRFPGAP